MIKNKGVFTRITVILQISILLFAATALSASAEEVPPSPLILEGDVLGIDGEKLDAGTEITAKLNGELVGATTVRSDGVYGDGPGNKLFVTCDSSDYENVKFYVDGEEYHTSTSLDGASEGEKMKMDLTATPSTSSEDEESAGAVGSSGGFGSSGMDSSSDTSEGTYEELNEESSEGTASAGVSSSEENAGEDVPASGPEATSITGMSIMAIVLVALLGVIAFLKYRSD